MAEVQRGVAGLGVAGVWEGRERDIWKLVGGERRREGRGESGKEIGRERED